MYVKREWLNGLPLHTHIEKTIRLLCNLKSKVSLQAISDLHFLLSNDEKSVTLELFFSNKLVDHFVRMFEGRRVLDGLTCNQNTFPAGEFYKLCLKHQLLIIPKLYNSDFYECIFIYVSLCLLRKLFSSDATRHLINQFIKRS